MKSALVQRYDALRDRLRDWMTQPDRDAAAVDSLIEELAQVQIDLKAEFGIKGNNPDE